MVETAHCTEAPTPAAEVLRDIHARGYRLAVRTRTEVHEHKVGPQVITYSDKLQLLGEEPIPPEMAEAIRANRAELLAAACVLAPPVPWLAVLTGRYLERRAPLVMLAANVAGFMGLSPAQDGPRLECVIVEALR